MKKLFNSLCDIVGPFVLVLIPILLFGILAGGTVLLNWNLGINGFGPERQETITVTRLYVDYSGSQDSSSSHYMVGTSSGVYEVKNFWIPFFLFNADELYSRLEVGKTYTVTLKGNKVVNFFLQQYPYITQIH